MFRAALDNPDGPGSDPYKTLPATPSEEDAVRILDIRDWRLEVTGSLRNLGW
jgi:hypothetical protein